MADSRDHFVWRLNHLEGAHKKDQETVDALERGVGDAREKIRELEREVRDLRLMVSKAQEQAGTVAKNLELKEREAEAEAKARSLVAKWLQIVLGALVLIGTLWSSRWISALDQIKAFLGVFR